MSQQHAQNKHVLHFTFTMVALIELGKFYIIVCDKNAIKSN